MSSAFRNPSDPPEEPPGDGPAHWSFGTTADVGIGARALSPESLFAHLGEGYTELLTDLASVEPKAARALQVSSPSLEGLVVAYLTELIGLFDEEGWLTRRYEVRLRGDPPRRIEARLQGETYDPARHRVKVQVKAVTLHRLEVDLARGRAQVIVDI